MVAREAVRGANYRALARMLRVCPERREALGRYLLGRGEYPYRCPVRTPQGRMAPTLYSVHDMWTLSEVFCREDYAAGPELRTAVDLGSNIGISALYFLTRCAGVRCWLYEPVPRNVERLRGNLAGLEGRYELREAAVAPAAGTATFGVEPTGRYGGIGVATASTIEVECVGVNEALGEALDEVPFVDVLKIDTEGTELELLAAIRPELLARVRTVYLEAPPRPAPDAAGFEASFRNETWALRRRARASWPRGGRRIVR
jgi:FkbM family methyltransferase